MICHCHPLPFNYSIDFLTIWIWGIASRSTSTHWPTVAIPTRVGMLWESHMEWSRFIHPQVLRNTRTQTHTCFSQTLHAQTALRIYACTCSNTAFMDSMTAGWPRIPAPSYKNTSSRIVLQLCWVLCPVRTLATPSLKIVIMWQL